MDLRPTNVPERENSRRYRVQLNVGEDGTRGFEGGPSAFVDNGTNNRPLDGLALHLQPAALGF